MVRLYELMGDIEAQSQPGHARVDVAPATKPVKGPGLLVPRDADPLVAHGHSHPVLHRAGRYMDGEV